MSDFVAGVVSGVIATGVGFSLTMLWDLWKDRRLTKRRDAAVIRSVNSDLDVNLRNIRENITALEHELTALSNHETLVMPISLLRVGFWEVAKINPPTFMLINEELAKLANIFEHSEAINDILRSREAYRLHNGAMSNFPRRMEMYDKEAIDILRRLELLILEYRQPQVGATSI